MSVSHLIHLLLSKIIQFHSPFTISLNRDKFQHVQTLPKPQHLSEGQRWCQSFLIWPAWLFGVGTEKLECLRSPCVRHLRMLVGSNHCGPALIQNAFIMMISVVGLTPFWLCPLPGLSLLLLYSSLFPPFLSLLLPSSPSPFHLFPLPLDPPVSL